MQVQSPIDERFLPHEEYRSGSERNSAGIPFLQVGRYEERLHLSENDRQYRTANVVTLREDARFQADLCEVPQWELGYLQNNSPFRMLYTDHTRPVGGNGTVRGLNEDAGSLKCKGALLSPVPR